jgi:hypothetical protein
MTPDRREELRRLNPRLEVPVLTDGDLVVVNSSDILQYLDWRYPERPLYPAAIEERVVARAFERLGDQRFDPIVVDCSYWHWAERDDEPPAGLLAAQRDIDELFDHLERVLLPRRSRGRSAGPASSNAPGLPTSPPCARLASSSTCSAFPSSINGFGRCGRIPSSSLMRSAPLRF